MSVKGEQNPYTISCGPARTWPRTNTSRRRGALLILAPMRKDSAWSQVIAEHWISNRMVGAL
jgi:hypothetical protein